MQSRLSLETGDTPDVVTLPNAVPRHWCRIPPVGDADAPEGERLRLAGESIEPVTDELRYTVTGPGQKAAIRRSAASFNPAAKPSASSRLRTCTISG